MKMIVTWIIYCEEQQVKTIISYLKKKIMFLVLYKPALLVQMILNITRISINDLTTTSGAVVSSSSSSCLSSEVCFCRGWSSKSSRDCSGLLVPALANFGTFPVPSLVFLFIWKVTETVVIIKQTSNTRYTRIYKHENSSTAMNIWKIRSLKAILIVVIWNLSHARYSDFYSELDSSFLVETRDICNIYNCNRDSTSTIWTSLWSTDNL